MAFLDFAIGGYELCDFVGRRVIKQPNLYECAQAQLQLLGVQIDRVPKDRP